MKCRFGMALALIVVACRARAPEGAAQAGASTVAPPQAVTSHGPASSSSTAPTTASSIAKDEPRADARVALPGLSCSSRSECYELLHWPADCESSWNSADFGAGLGALALDSSHVVVQVACAPGAYQPLVVYLLVERAADSSIPKSRLLRFRTYESPDDGKLVAATVTEIGGTTEFDEARHELTVHRKFRGPGDCGLRAIYRFEHNEPVVREMRAKTHCDGVYVEPERWPRVAPP
ncbi:MAG TPA: DUF1176 domain-containing protein [Polyangiaceae bacterium]